MEKATELNLVPGARLVSNPLDAVDGAEALIIATEWKEFANVDFGQVKQKMHTPLVFDGRNLLDPVTMRNLGFTYKGIGRQTNPKG